MKSEKILRLLTSGNKEDIDVAIEVMIASNLSYNRWVTIIRRARHAVESEIGSFPPEQIRYKITNGNKWFWFKYWDKIFKSQTRDKQVMYAYGRYGFKTIKLDK